MHTSIQFLNNLIIGNVLVINAPSPSLCVVVCVHNAPDYTSICIDSILKHTPQPYELVIVNDGSNAQTSAMLQQYSEQYDHVRLIHHGVAKGYTGAANAGLKTSKSDYTILLNSDTIVSEHWSAQLIACGESDDKIGIVGPLSNAATYQSVPFVFDEHGHWKQNTLPGDTTVTQYARAICDVSAKSYPRVPVANGFCFVVKRAVIDRIGYLDEETFPRGYGEENDYCLRATDAGFEIAIADDAYVYHATSKSFGVKQRESLTRDAHHAIRSKYSKERLDGIDHALRNNDAMDAVRKRIERYVFHATQNTLISKNLPSLEATHRDLSVLFLLPDCSPKAGGTQVIVETARGLSAMGITARIAMKHTSKKDYESFFPADAHLFWYYDSDRALVKHAREYKVAVATIFHSIQQLKKITDAHAHIEPTYFVQDYEPYFLEDHPQLQSLAEQSYTMIKGCTLFAISPWVCDVIQEKHKQTVSKILGSLDQELFYPDVMRSHNTPLVISAMIRPSTSWRGPKLTMRVLTHLKGQHGEQIDIRLFGCSYRDLDFHDIEHSFAHHNYGVLGRRQVASLLRASHLFLDLSDFQAFGRTALEAMACGAAVVAPQEGGVHDFGVDGENILLVDTADESACVHAANQLIEDDALRESISTAAIQTGLNYSIPRSTLSFATLMAELVGSHSTRKQTRESA